ncbi:MAG: hypothetical protein ABR540_15025 [Acidimicrobiales bacterium]|nr:hypothetical protein [Actinomycetota bacterium]
MAIVPAAAFAALLGLQAVAFACVPTSAQTNVSTTSAEPGDAIQVGATGLGAANSPYRLRMAASAANPHAGPFMGGTANTDASRNIPMVTRIIPTNATSGVRYLCWVSPSENDNSSPVAFTIL